MIDLHAHTLFSDGELLPSELVRRAEEKGYEAIALTDHVDSSNIDFVLPRIVNVCGTLNRYWKITSIPGVEITHVPLQEIKKLVRYSRNNGAKIVVVHGETIAEPVLPGTNRCGIEARCDILAHPGMITKEDALLAKEMGVFLEITTRKSHSAANRHVVKVARLTGAKLVLNNDSHSPKGLVSEYAARRILKELGFTLKTEINDIFNNSAYLITKRA